MSLQDPHYLTVAEAAKLLRLSRMTVYRMIDAGDIDAMLIGKRVYRIPEAALRKFLPAAAAEHPAGKAP